MTDDTKHPPAANPTKPALPATASPKAVDPVDPVEIGGPTGPEPTRYGDWERGGRCSDF